MNNPPVPSSNIVVADSVRDTLSNAVAALRMFDTVRLHEFDKKDFQGLKLTLTAVTDALEYCQAFLSGGDRPAVDETRPAEAKVH